MLIDEQHIGGMRIDPKQFDCLFGLAVFALQHEPVTGGAHQFLRHLAVLLVDRAKRRRFIAAATGSRFRPGLWGGGRRGICGGFPRPRPGH